MKSSDPMRERLRQRFEKVRRPTEIIPPPPSKPAGTFQHFDSEEARQNHLAEVAKNEGAF